MKVRGRVRGRLACLLLPFVVLALVGEVGADSPAPIPLLFETPAVGSDTVSAVTHSASRATIRSRRVRVRLDVLTNPDGSARIVAGQRIGLNLFDDTSFTATIAAVTTRASFRLTWNGALEGIDLGYAALAVNDGAVVGTVIMPGAVYRIGYASDGAQVVEQIDPSALPKEIEPRRAAQPVADANDQVPADVEGPPLPGGADSASQIDVMVLFTSAARTAAGGTTAMLGEAALAVETANQAYANSGLVQRLRLVHAGEVALTETEDIEKDLDSLTKHALVRQLRDMTRADLVSLITSNKDLSSCGIAWLMVQNVAAFAPFGFSIADLDCATANLTFPHELGHNMGAHHDVFVVQADEQPGDDILFAYSHGYVDMVGKFRTIMAYPDQCAAAGVVGGCPRIPFFSTPNLTHNGRVMGNASTADNARTLGQTAETVANFRQALASPLTVSAGVSESSFTVGQTVAAVAEIVNPGMPGAADIYVGLMFPNGVVVFFTPKSPIGFTVGTITSLASYRPFSTGVSLVSPFSMVAPVLSYRRTGIEPDGGFAFFVLVVNAGGLGAGLNSDQILGAAISSFSFH